VFASLLLYKYEVILHNSRMKLLYVLGVIFVCVLAAPLGLGIGIYIMISSGLPIFYLQRRIGLNGIPFTIWKFRTMYQGADKKQKLLAKQNEAHGPVFKIRNDPRYTRVGRFLAHTGLDELPQLYNVLRGDMALIGPRPLPLAEARQLKSWQTKRHDVKPGIMSPWILEGYHAQTFDAWMKSDIDYIHKKSLRYDITLALQTVGLLIRLFCSELLGLS
jgi:lipopolysaccharide/colanic/teichoic acid biosynthesis glycosyltransferase